MYIDTGGGIPRPLAFLVPQLSGRYGVLKFSTWRRGYSLPGLLPSSCWVLLGRLFRKGREAFLLCSGFERQGSNWQEGPLGAGQLFQELVWLQLRGKQERKNKEVGIPRAEIPDMPWGSAKEQNCKGVGRLQQGHPTSVLGNL